MSNQNLDGSDFVNLNVKCIHYLAYFVLHQQQSRIKKIFYQLRSFVILGFAYIQVSSEVINMIFAFGNIEEMTTGSLILLTNLVHLVKLYKFLFEDAKIRMLIKNMNKKEFIPQNNAQCAILKIGIRRSKIITTTFLSMCCATCVVFVIFPFLDRAEGEAVKLPLSGWYPFDTRASPMFEIIYTYQILATCINGMRNISIDTFISGCIMVIWGQLSVLNASLQSLKNTEDSHTVMKKELLNNIIHYKEIIKFADDVTALFSACLICQFAVSVIIICMTMFQMSLVSPLSLQFVSMALYQSCILMEIFLWCYYGNEVILQSTKLTTSAFMCEWIDCSKKFKKDLLFFMTRSQFSLKLYAGGYFTLSLETFTAILKSSWSYFALLNTVHNKEIY